MNILTIHLLLAHKVVEVMVVSFFLYEIFLILIFLGSDRELQNLLSSMSQQQLMQLFGNVGGMPGLSSLLVPSERYFACLCKLTV